MSKRVFFVCSTGRCGTKYLASLLNLAPNATVVHEPEPGLEFVNSFGYCMFFLDRDRFIGNNVCEVRPSNREDYFGIDVEDISRLHRHVETFRSCGSEVYGGCHNSLSPFIFATFKYMQRHNIQCKFVQLLRDPFDCCLSILRMEGPNGYGQYRRNFNLRSASLYTGCRTPTEITAAIWSNVNKIINTQLEQVNCECSSVTTVVKIEEMDTLSRLSKLYTFLGLELPRVEQMRGIMENETYTVRHSHCKMLDEAGINNVTAQELLELKDLTDPLRKAYGYGTELSERLPL